MKAFVNLAFCFTLLLGIAVRGVDAQTIAAVAQNRPQVAAHHYAHPAAARPNVVGARNFAPRPAGYVPRTMSPYMVRTVGRPAVNFRPNYSPYVRRINPTILAAINARRIALAENRRRTFTPYNSGIAPIESTRPTFRSDGSTTATTENQPPVTTHDAQPIGPEPGRHEPGQNGAPNTQDHNGGNHHSFSDALHAHHHEWHNRDWWQQHCPTIVFVTTGYYFLDGSYWYPAYGYDPLNSNYDYDGPVYTTGNLLPDEMIANVQGALQQAGYYDGPVTGSMDVETRAALANFQRDQGLEITGAIDESTVETLGLSSQSGY